MKKTCIALALVSCLAFAACGSGGEDGGSGDSGQPASPAVGTWVIDTAATLKSIESGLDPNTPPQMVEQMKEMIGAIKGKMKVNADGTFTGDMEMPSPMGGEAESQRGEGTWTLEGDQFSITTTSENGQPKENPDTETATLKDGVITVSPAGAPFSIIFRKQ
jgi:hypothetical protein